MFYQQIEIEKENSNTNNGSKKEMFDKIIKTKSPSNKTSENGSVDLNNNSVTLTEDSTFNFESQDIFDTLNHFSSKLWNKSMNAKEHTSLNTELQEYIESGDFHDLILVDQCCQNTQSKTNIETSNIDTIRNDSLASSRFDFSKINDTKVFKFDKRIQPEEMKYLQVKLHLLEQESKSYEDLLLFEELKIKSAICEIDQITSMKNKILDSIKYFQQMLHKLEESEKNLKTDIIELRSRIDIKSKKMESIAFAKDEIENQIEHEYSSHSTSYTKPD